LEIFDSDREFGNTGYTAAFDGERYSGNGLHAVLSHSQKHYQFFVGYNDFSPTYQTYNGFFTSTGYRQYFMRHGYTFYPEESFVDRATLRVFGNMSINYNGTKKEQVVQPQLNLNLKGQTYVNISYLLVNDEKFFGVDFRGIHRTMFNINTRPIDLFSISLYGSVGKFIYRSSSPTVGRGHNFGASVTLKPTSKINLSISYDRARLSSVDTGELYYDGNIYRGVGIYQFSPEMFFRIIAQYNSFAENFQFYPLFSYKMNAFTTFYLGATSDYLNYGEGFGVKNIAQQYFLKVQYLFGI
jgi:hypothetical protein